VVKKNKDQGEKQTNNSGRKKTLGDLRDKKEKKKSLKKSLFRGGYPMDLTTFQRRNDKKVTEKSLSPPKKSLKSHFSPGLGVMKKVTFE
jgi:hypothetical protein